MLFRLILLFTIVPFAELVLLLWLSDVTSWQFTVLLVLVTGVVGAWLARLQGWQTWQKIQRQLSSGEAPAGTLVDALLIFVAGALLLTPGILTDAVGFSLLIPPARAVIKKWLSAKFRGSMVMQGQGAAAQFWAGTQNSQNRHNEQIIEVQATHKTDSDHD
ncbi:phage T7 F exclusion suppressor FxsA [Symmachiella dynata]|uniref:Phage T7 F exclusion suppressor FxsA n=1 Tax=Symmachiella dynata TaxID=2527995 RepID=A0A517ZJF4_9PLAN|nr:FxsA family protein [Symmachiella dynata]QDU42625.1 phage T7 F exclusion suppressor FxsA [Symmachiella dynata]